MITKKSVQIRQLREKLKHCQSYSEYREKARELDKLMGNNAWKQTPESKFYDYLNLQEVISQMDDAMKRNDVTQLAKLLRESSKHSLGGIAKTIKYHVRNITSVR